MSDNDQDVNGDVVLGQVIDNDAHVDQIQLSHLNNKSDEDMNTESHQLTAVNSDDVPIEIRQRSSCELCKSLIGAAAGNFLEWFDFAIFGLLADEIGHNFFPKSANGVQLLQAFAVYAGAFLMRPLGGALFGWIGDKYGRLNALRISIFMMAFPTFLTGCLPTYHDIGITATILLVLLRLIQGLSVGGEITGALVYVLEICPPNRRSLFGILVQVSGSGTLLAIIVEATMRAVFTDDQIYDWAWRLPFLGGIFVAAFGIWIRKALPMSDDFLKNKDEGKLKENPILYVLWNNKLIILILVCHLCIQGSSYYTIYVWLPTYLHELREDPLENAYAITVGVMFIGMAFGIFSGWLGDKYSPIRVLLTGGVVYLIGVVIFFPILGTANEGMAAFAMIVIGILHGLFSGPSSVWAIDQLGDASTRYTALGIGYNISLALFGGTAPLLATAISNGEGGIIAWSWVIFIYGIISLSTDALVTRYNIKQQNKNELQTLDDNINNGVVTDQIEL
mmetsp:Transcript_35817/g.31600  ORF Transcript_35817/g.31600 Transcript_35817/m.31600 type:complete len:506 (-) Transcript_35817:47-1564(-)